MFGHHKAHLNVIPTEPNDTSSDHYDEAAGLARLSSPRIHTFHAYSDDGQARYEEIKSELLRLTGGVRLADKIDLAEGMSRLGDFILEQEVVARLEKRKESAPKLQILEVGAGKSYPSRSYTGGPWLARYLAKLFGDEIDVVATDIDTKVDVFYVNDKGVVRVFDFHVRPEEMSSAITEVNASSGELEFESISRIEAIEKLESFVRDNNHPDDWDYYLKKYFNRSENSRWYVRPSLDPAFEESRYGLKVRTSVDMYNLANSFTDNQRYDLVFGRFLVPPSSPDEVKKAIESARGVLNDEGGGFIQFDKGIKWPLKLPFRFGNQVMKNGR